MQLKIINSNQDQQLFRVFFLFIDTEGFILFIGSRNVFSSLYLPIFHSQGISVGMDSVHDIILNI